VLVIARRSQAHCDCPTQRFVGASLHSKKTDRLLALAAFNHLNDSITESVLKLL
jgi:hypothetical protein